MNKKRKLAISLSAVGVSVTVLLIFLLAWFYGASYPEYQKMRNKEFSIPGLKEGISPQGLCVLPESVEYDFAMSGYMVGGSASRVYFIDKETSKHKYFTLTRNGEAVGSHFGGITATENYILIADENKITRVKISDAVAAEDGAAIEVFDEFETDINNAYCHYDKAGHKLYVGEFYREKNYKTAKSHHITVNGETNYAFIYEYRVDEAQKGGVVSAMPDKAISVRGLVQGVAVTADNIYLSTSYALADSHLYVYENPLNGATEETATVNETEIPLYRLDKTNLIKDHTMPCMSEEICVENDRICILYESLCNKYKYFTRTRINKVHSIALSDLV